MTPSPTFRVVRVVLLAAFAVFFFGPLLAMLDFSTRAPGGNAPICVCSTLPRWVASAHRKMPGWPVAGSVRSVSRVQVGRGAVGRQPNTWLSLEIRP